jgi:hypothetical protein
MKLKMNFKSIGTTIGSIIGYIAIITGIVMTVLLLETIFSGI